MSDVSGFLVPAGFRFAAGKAGLKKSGRPDLALIVAEDGASAAALYTANKVTAAPLKIDQEHMAASEGRVRVVVVNAGNANCAAGQAGMVAAREVCRAAAGLFGCEEREVFPSSTGIIGVPLPAEKVVAALPGLKADLGGESDHFAAVASAIITTDLVEKTAFARVMLPDITGVEREVRIAGVGKGSGMIGPRLKGPELTGVQLDGAGLVDASGLHATAPHATMLMYLLTDAEMSPVSMQRILGRVVEKSFNRISVDGDTSTNDTVLLLASGKSGAPRILDSGEEGDRKFEEALTQVATSLARQVVADGEGVGHVVELRVHGAASDADAVKVAKAIAHSPLVKTAWAGKDPNWGRLVAAIGYSGAEVDEDRIDISFGELAICRDGGRAPGFDEVAAHDYLSQTEYSITIDLHQVVTDGTTGSCVFWTTDLTAEYVRINADYST